MNIVASLFEKKGYTLANKVFHDCMNKTVSIILGVNTCHVIETKVVTFGHNCNTSAYLDSRLGVIPMGSVSNILKNANFLPKAKDSCSYSVTEEFCSSESFLNTDLVNCEVEVFCMSMDSDISMLDIKGEINEKELMTATEQMLEQKCNSYLNVDEPFTASSVSELNEDLCDFTIENTVRDTDSGRLNLPLPWNPHNKHLMDNNFNLAKKILDNNVCKLKNDAVKLTQYNEVIAKQESEGIIEKIPHLDTFLQENPKGVRFLARNGVFRPDHQSTKCRIVFLSNLRRNSNLLCHNQCSYPAPNLNNKMNTAF